jgi:hypothetical protein
LPKTQTEVFPTTKQPPSDGENGTKDNSKVLGFNYKELGHYPSRCPERYNKTNTQGSMKKDLNIITCYKYKQKEHYTRRCTKEGTRGL